MAWQVRQEAGQDRSGMIPIRTGLVRGKAGGVKQEAGQEGSGKKQGRTF